MAYFNDEYTFNQLKDHIGHTIQCVQYGNEETGIVNVALECETCHEVLCDCDKPEDMEYVRLVQKYPEEIHIGWSVEDVYDALMSEGLVADPPLTRQEAAYVLHQIEKHHDATYGVTWDTLVIWARDLFKERFKK